MIDLGMLFLFFFFLPPSPPNQQAGHSHILFSIQNWIFFFNGTVQASSCQLVVTRERFFALWRRNRNREEWTTVIQLVTRWDGLLGYSLMRTHCRFFLFFRFRNNSASFCDKSLQHHPFWMTPSNLLCNWRLKLELLKQSVIWTVYVNHACKRESVHLFSAWFTAALFVCKSILCGTVLKNCSSYCIFL